MRSDPGPVYWQAQAAALKFLGTRLKTEAQVDQKLQTLGYPEEIREAVMAFLREYGYVNDAGFCDSFIRDRVRFHPCGRFRLEMELRQKGVEPAVIHAALDRAELDETGEVLELLRRKRFDAAQATPEEKRKIATFLQRRGFSRETVREAFRLAAEENRDE